MGNQNAYYPINFYDTREGEMRDNANGCAVNGIMNAVELNVGNLGQWLAGKAPYAGDVGKTVNYANQNGYILYFSDHRGMLVDPNPSNGGQTPAGVISGEVRTGGCDQLRASRYTSTTPDGVKEATSYYTYSPEDVDQNGFLDNWGGKNIGYGFGVNTNTTPPNPYLTTNCATTGLTNAVSGARHVLKLVDGGMNARHQLPAGSLGQQTGRIHGRLREPGLRPGQLQQRSVGSLLGRRQQHNPARGGGHYRRHGYVALQQLDRRQQPE